MERGYSLRRDATPQTRAHLKSNPIFRRERERDICITRGNAGNLGKNVVHN
jgi:hypothetical protein